MNDDNFDGDFAANLLLDKGTRVAKSELPIQNWLETLGSSRGSM